MSERTGVARTGQAQGALCSAAASEVRPRAEQQPRVDLSGAAGDEQPGGRALERPTHDLVDDDDQSFTALFLQHPTHLPPTIGVQSLPPLHLLPPTLHYATLAPTPSAPHPPRYLPDPSILVAPSLSNRPSSIQHL